MFCHWLEAVREEHGLNSNTGAGAQSSAAGGYQRAAPLSREERGVWHIKSLYSPSFHPLLTPILTPNFSLSCCPWNSIYNHGPPLPLPLDSIPVFPPVLLFHPPLISLQFSPTFLLLLMKSSVPPLFSDPSRKWEFLLACARGGFSDSFLAAVRKGRLAPTQMHA